MIEGHVVSDGHVTTLEALIACGLVMHLYTNVRTPTSDDRMASYEEPRVAGYKPVALSKNTQEWKIERGTPSRAVHTEIEFRFQAPGVTIIGYFLVAGPRLYGVQPLKKPFEVLNPGDVLGLTPILVRLIRGGAAGTGGTAQTPAKRNPRAPAAETTWFDDTTAITPGITPVTHLTVGVAQTGGMGGWVALEVDHAPAMKPNGGADGNLEVGSLANAASVVIEATAEFQEN